MTDPTDLTDLNIDQRALWRTLYAASYQYGGNVEIAIHRAHHGVKMLNEYLDDAFTTKKTGAHLVMALQGVGRRTESYMMHPPTDKETPIV